ncbi:MAG: DnaJ domain-containing protein [Chloroflexota bacterium]
MSAETDHYAVLGIPRGASLDEIRGAYRRAARASHPDLHPGDADALARFKRVQVAYEVLVDPDRRDAYDRPSTAATVPRQHRAPRRPPDPDEPVSLARELGETVRAIRVHARRSGFARRVQRLIRYLESLDRPG